MITLNDYLYSGDTVLKILQNYSRDLRIESQKQNNEIDLLHSDFLLQIKELLEHNDFLTAQSQKMREFYKYMAKEYPFLAFTFKGRIKSLIRAEEKFNGYIVETIYDHYKESGTYPTLEELKGRLSCFRDLIAYRIVISMPRCHLRHGEDRESQELRYLYDIANVLPKFLEQHGFIPEHAKGVKESTSSFLLDEVKPYYRDYVCVRAPVVISLCTLLSMIIVPTVILRYRSGQSLWMILPRSEQLITVVMRRNRKKNVQEES